MSEEKPKSNPDRFPGPYGRALFFYNIAVERAYKRCLEKHGIMLSLDEGGLVRDEVLQHMLSNKELDMVTGEKSSAGKLLRFFLTRAPSEEDAYYKKETAAAIHKLGADAETLLKQIEKDAVEELKATYPRFEASLVKYHSDDAFWEEANHARTDMPQTRVNDITAESRGKDLGTGLA